MVKGRAQLSEVNRESRGFPSSLPWRSAALSCCWAELCTLACASQNESFNCEEPSSAGGVAQTTISHPGSKVFFREKVTSQQPGLFLTKFYCKFLLKDILIIYKL